MEHPRTLLSGINILNPFRRRYKPALELAFEAFKEGKRGLNALGQEGQSLLHLAIIENNRDICKELLNNGAALANPNKWGMTPVRLAELFNRDMLRKKDETPLLIYRNADQKVHSMSVDEFEKRLKIEYIDELEFDNIDHLSWVVEKCKKRLNKHHFDQMNNWVLAMHEKAIGSIKRDHYYVRWVNPRLGYGVFAAKDMPALTYVGQYTGVIKRRKFRKNRFNDYVFGYVVGPRDTPFIVDAQEKGNFSRFVNHSDEPNLTSRWVIINGITRIILFSNQFIPKGKQLTYDYGQYYWRSRTAPELLV